MNQIFFSTLLALDFSDEIVTLQIELKEVVASCCCSRDAFYFYLKAQLSFVGLGSKNIFSDGIFGNVARNLGRLLRF